MEEQSSQEILKAYAKNSGRELVYEEKHYSGRVYKGIQKKRKTFFIKNGKRKQVFYAGLWDNTQLESSTLSGFFFELDFPAQSKMTIRKKDFLDILNPSTRKKCIKTGVGDFDRKALVTGNDIYTIQKILMNRTVQHQILKILSTQPAISIEINTTRPDFIPGFFDNSSAQQSALGVLKRREWILEPETIEELYDLTEHLSELLP